MKDNRSSTQKIMDILAVQLGVDSTITTDSKLREDLMCDELDIVEIAMAMEEDFDMEISDEQMERAITVGDLVALVEED